MEVFSTIASPVFSELIVVIIADLVTRLPSEVPFFETLRTMNEVRPFKLVFLLEAPEKNRGEAQRMLTEALDLVTARGLLDFLDFPPIIRSTSPTWKNSYF
jgi:hypothetical protein